MKINVYIENLTALYGKRKVLDGLNAEFVAKKINAVLGKSGGGKSTLARVLLGLLEIEEGKVIIGGKDISKLNTKQFNILRQEFGVLFQDGALLSSLSLWENVALPLSEHTKLTNKELRKKALEILKMVDLEDFADYFPDELSGGMRKRAGLARGLINKPSLLICDEPTSGLDPITARKMDRLLVNMAKLHEDMTIVLITHDLKSVENIADNVLLIEDGKSIFCGAKEDFYASIDKSIRKYIED